MPTITGHHEDTWVLDQDALTWTVAENGHIETDNTFGIADNGDNSNVRVLGWVTCDGGSGVGGIGVSMGESSNTYVGRSGWISGFAGGLSYGKNSTVTNDGLIDGLNTGTFAESGGKLDNRGTIQGGEYGSGLGENSELTNSGVIRSTFIGVFSAGANVTILNETSGLIIGGESGIYVSEDSVAVIKNQGSIRSIEGVAIEGNSLGKMTLHNTGTIYGDVVLGDLGNVADMRKGTITGQIYGGNGDDAYTVDKAKIAIVESIDGSGADIVKSTVTFHLSANVELLQLLGRKAINAFGNDGANILTGNIGKNTLSGGAGADALYGVQGNDRLIGGEGGDVFVFGKDYDKDTIRDFEDDLDQIWLVGVTNQKQFDALKITKSGDDLIVDYGHGDRLIIEDLKKQDLTVDDLYNFPA